MRRRDILFVCVAFGGLVAGLVWALSTQSRWVRENKPLDVQQPAVGPAAPEAAPTPATGVIGTVGEDTRVSLGKELAPRKPQEQTPLVAPAPRKPTRAPGKGQQGASPG